MKSYYYPSLFFRKKWIWFADPADVGDADLAVFFSYNKVDAAGFKRREGLTSAIELSRDLDDIWSAMRKNFVCKQIVKGERNGIMVKVSKNFREFKKVYLDFRRGKNIPRENYRVFERNGLLFSAYYENKMIAGGVFVADGKYMRAWVLASARLDEADGRQRDIIGQANRMVIWEAVKYAKNHGYELFDLGGINPGSSDKSQISLSEFKEAFGGERKPAYYYNKVYSRLLKRWIRFTR